MECVISGSTVEPVAPFRAAQRVVAGSAVDHAHPIVAPVDQRGQIQPAVAANELDDIVPAQPGDAELLDQRDALGIHPDRLKCEVELTVAELHKQLPARCRAGDGRFAGHRLPQADRVAQLSPFDQQHVGGVVVVDGVLAGIVPIVSVDCVTKFRVGLRLPVDVRMGVQQEHVDTSPAVQYVVSLLPFDPVAVGPAPQLVASISAVELVRPRPAIHDIVACSAGEIVVSGTAVQHLRVARTEEEVASRSAE